MKLFGLVRTLVLGAAITLLVGLASGVGVPLASPDAMTVPHGPYWPVAFVVFACLMTLALGALLSVRVLSGMRPLQGAPPAVTTAVREACVAARLPPPVCWGIERAVERPVVLRGLRQSHLVVSARHASDPDAVARTCVRELAGGAARITLLSCATALALAFWTNLCAYCTTPWSRRTTLGPAARIGLAFLPLPLLILLPITAVAYLAALATVPLAGRGRTRALVAAFGAQGAHARLLLIGQPAGWPAAAGWTGIAVNHPQERRVVAAHADGLPPGRPWVRPLEVAAGMRGVATVALAGVVLLAVLVGHWIAVGVAQRGTWSGERAESATVLAVRHDSGRRGMIASLGGHWTPRVRLADGHVADLPTSTHETVAGERLPVAVTAGDARVRSRRQDSTAYLLGAVLFTGALLAAGAFAAARLSTFPAAVRACGRAQAAAAADRRGDPDAPAASTLDRLLFRLRSLAPVWIGGLLVSPILAAVTLEPLGSLIGGALGDAWGGKRIGFLGGTLVYMAGVVWVSVQALVKGWSDDDYRRWLETRFGTSDELGGFSAQPLPS